MKKSGKKWLSLHFDPLEEKKSKNSRPTKTKQSAAFSNFEIPSGKNRIFNFHQYFSPKSVNDLAIHPKKIKEVELWLQDNVKKPSGKTAKFLLITGPTGSGKTTTVQVLCKHMGIEVSEWINPVDQDYEIFQGPNQINRFIEFLTESKWNSLFSNSSEKVILVKEFPNAVLRNPEEFDHILEECYYKGNFPMIFICTSSFNSKVQISEKLFAQDIVNKYKIPEISFNSCASTFLKQALKRAQSLAQESPDLFKATSPSTIEAIMATAMGDIKSAINQYYFASLKGSSEMPTQKLGTKRKRNESSSVQVMSKDENLGLFHAIGRVLNPKRVQTENSWRLNCDLAKLVDEFSTQPGSFTAFLFTNYVKYFGDIFDLFGAVACLSESQIFLEKWIDRADVFVYALWISTMGLMIFNEHRISKWTPITGPGKLKSRVSQNSSDGGVPATDLYYVNIIKNTENCRFVT